ncbi:MAG: hypothetical protein WCT49_02770 [Candidatus Paceibacterota bacterium]|jgi:hypothetical protein|nr:pilin [Candidatus Paceibacterota bacterium]
MKKNIRNLLLFVGSFFPLGALAQSTLWTVTGVFGYIIWSLGTILPLLAFGVFMYGLAKFILSSGDPKKVEEGKGIMTWGVVALFVLISIWGIIGFMDRSFGTDVGPGNFEIPIPILPG